MYFSFAITTSKNTAESDKLQTELKLSEGIIHLVRIQNHRGNRGTVHLQIYQGGHQVYPLNRGDDFHGNGLEVTFKDFFELKPAQNVLTAYTWNDSTKYSHEFIIEFGVLPIWVLLPALLEAPPGAAEIPELGEWKEI